MKPGFDLGGGGGGGVVGEEEESDSLSSLNLLEDSSAPGGILDDDANFNTNDENEDNNSAQPSAGVKRKLKYNYSNRKRKCRTTFTKGQLNVLEAEFVKSNFVSNDKIDSIVEQTGLDSRIIKNWFKNKRSRVLADSKQPTTGMNGVAKITQQQQPQQQPQLLNNSQPATTINQLKYSPNPSVNMTTTTTMTPPISTINHISQQHMMISPPLIKPPMNGCGELEQTQTHHYHQHYHQHHQHQLVNHSSSQQTHMSTMSPVASAPASLCLKINTEMKPEHHFNTPPLSSSTEINGYHQYQQKPVVLQQQQQQPQRLNKNLNGLLDIVNSLKPDSKTTSSGTTHQATNVNKPSPQQQQQQLTTTTSTTTARLIAQSQAEQCQHCAKYLCTCNISRSTLSHLYRNFSGFNSIEKQHNHHHQHQQYYSGNGNDSIGYQVVRRAVCHPTKQWTEQHKDLYSFFDANETEKIFFVL